MESALQGRDPRDDHGREPWELGALLIVLFVTNLSSREWAGALGSVFVTAVAVVVASVLLKRVKQAIPPQVMVAYWRWFASSDVYTVGREESCKPLVLDGSRDQRWESQTC